MKDRYIQRITFPDNARTSNIVHNEPDVPLPERKLFPKLSVRLHPNSIRSIRIIPEVTTPVLRSRLTSVGGGRTIGGGTSKEAIRRAKRHAKEQRFRQNTI